jgi:hypothetical protein
VTELGKNGAWGEPGEVIESQAVSRAQEKLAAVILNGKTIEENIFLRKLGQKENRLVPPKLSRAGGQLRGKPGENFLAGNRLCYARRKRDREGGGLRRGGEGGPSAARG